jgi:hypothetical protein
VNADGDSQFFVIAQLWRYAPTAALLPGCLFSLALEARRDSYEVGTTPQRRGDSCICGLKNWPMKAGHP